jgi:tetratricopeptide (TPR) repeat protein
MTKQHYLVIAGVLALFLVLYLGCDTKPPGQYQIERSRSLQSETTDVSNLIRDAHDALPANQWSNIQAWQEEVNTATTDSVKVAYLKLIAGSWYENGYPSISGHYAQEIAEITATEEAWSIAGTTFAICIQKSEDQKVKAFCQQRGVQALENAISLNPSEDSYRVNLALLYTDFPPPNEPMKGVLMLRELEDMFPESALVLTSLAQLAIRTGQFDRAIQRLEQALTLDANNKKAVCLMAQAQAGAGNQELAQTFEQRCLNDQ